MGQGKDKKERTCCKMTTNKYSKPNKAKAIDEIFPIASVNANDVDEDHASINVEEESSNESFDANNDKVEQTMAAAEEKADTNPIVNKSNKE